MDPTPQETTYWKKCSSCKKEIGFGTVYKLCSVSTCRSKRTGLIFCSVACWDAHLGFANHRESYAEEHTSPSRSEYLRSLESEDNSQQPVRRKVITSASHQTGSAQKTSADTANVDTLIVVSKIKKFIHDQSGFNTSKCCIDALTQKVVQECRKAMEKAEESGRKTVMGRDVS